MKLTVLQMTQNILSSLDSDAVNSIGDTSESLQVATILQTTFFNMVSRAGLPDQMQLFQLTPSNDVNKPVLMFKPANVDKIDWLKYLDTNPNDSQQVDQFGSFSHDLNTDIVPTNSFLTVSSTSNTIGIGNFTFTVLPGLNCTIGELVLVTAGAFGGGNQMMGSIISYTGTTMIIKVTQTLGSGTFSAWTITGPFQGFLSPVYKYVTLLPVQQFLDMTNNFNLNDSNVSSFVFTEGANSFTFYYKNNIQPQYATVIENFYFIFDSFDNTQDSTLQGSKTMCSGQTIPVFTMQDSFIPDLDDYQFPLLLSEAKSLAFFELKQTVHQKAEMENKRQWSQVQKNKSIDNKPSHFDQLPDFGRRAWSGSAGEWFHTFRQNPGT